MADGAMPGGTIIDALSEPPVAITPPAPIGWQGSIAALQFVVLTLFTLYLTRSIVVPITCAIVLKLVLQPSVRHLESWHVPRGVAAPAVLCAVIGVLVSVIAAIGAPAAAWFATLPDNIGRLQKQAGFITVPLRTFQRFLDTLEQFTSSGHTAVQVQPVASSHALSQVLVEGTAGVAGAFAIAVIMTLFLLLFGDLFLRRLVEVLPRFRDKRRAVEITVQIECDIGAYLRTIAAMNTLVGVLTGVVAWATGLGNPLMWAAAAFLLNFVPTIGALVCFCALLLSGLIALHPLWHCILPACLYLPIHITESQFITPLLLARRFAMNPVLVMASVLFWFWIWGIAGAILAVPLLAITKIICDRIPTLAPIGHMIGA
jgi:predicted PurR-regulated permease PerM